MNNVVDSSFEKKFQRVLLETFQHTIEFLDAYGIRWFACGGTCLGAVRHKNIIPWDDDVDIFVLREDYEKLFKIRDKLGAYSLDMRSIEDGPDYYQGYIKIYNNTTTLWERKEYEYVVGIYIDVFPIERSNINGDELLEVMNIYRNAIIYRESICVTTFSDILHWIKEMHLLRIWDRLKIMLKQKDKALSYKKFLESTRLIRNESNGKYIMCPMGAYGKKDHYPAKWFDQYLSVPFDSFDVKLPVGYHEYLTQLYGDYMKLPPIEYQRSHHDHYYCNLNEKLSLEECKDRISKGEFLSF